MKNIFYIYENPMVTNNWQVRLKGSHFCLSNAFNKEGALTMVRNLLVKYKGTDGIIKSIESKGIQPVEGIALERKNAEEKDSYIYEEEILQVVREVKIEMMHLVSGVKFKEKPKVFKATLEASYKTSSSKKVLKNSFMSPVIIKK